MQQPVVFGLVAVQQNCTSSQVRGRFAREVNTLESTNPTGYCITGPYLGNPIWIRSVIVPPRLGDGRRWTLWQYSNRDRLLGYQGGERFIDMNVYAGSREQFEELAVP